MISKGTFSVDQAALRAGVQLCAAFSERSNTIAILSALHFKASKDQHGSGSGTLTITGTDLDTTYRAPVPIKGITGDLSFALKADRLASYVGLLPSEVIDIEIHPNKWARLSHKKGYCRMAGFDADSFPEITEGPLENPVEIPLIIIGDALRRSRVAIPKREGRGIVQGVLLELQPNGVAAVSTDGHRLLWTFTEIQLGIKRVIIGPEGITAILRLADATKAEKAIFSSDGVRCRAEAGGHSVTTKAISEKFPDYVEIMAADYAYKVVVPRPGLLDKVRLASAADENSILLKFVAGSLFVKSESSSGIDAGTMMFEDDIPVLYDGPDVEITLETRYLEEFLQICQKGTIEIHFTSGLRMVEFREPDDPNTRYLLMPKRPVAGKAAGK